eukprot:scaffold10623_cov65-Cyclotella_meneghiniana.AAC.5
MVLNRDCSAIMKGAQVGGYSALYVWKILGAYSCVPDTFDCEITSLIGSPSQSPITATSTSMFEAAPQP